MTQSWFLYTLACFLVLLRGTQSDSIPSRVEDGGKASSLDMSSERQDTLRRTETLTAFLKWLEAGGADISQLKVKDSTADGHGMILTAAQDIKEMSVFLTIPNRLVVSLDSVLASPLGDMVEAENVTLYNDKTAIAWFLNYQNLLPNSFWRPYLDMLPRSFTNALAFSEDELQATYHYHIGHLTNQTRRIFENDYTHNCPRLVDEYPDILPRAFCDRDNYLWAYQCVKTRSFAILGDKADDDRGGVVADKRVTNSSDGTFDSQLNKTLPIDNPDDERVTPHIDAGRTLNPATSYVAPFADFANHDPSAKASWAESSGSFKLMTDQAWRVDEEVFLYYCRNASDDQFLTSFGFVPEGNDDENHLTWHVFTGYFDPEDALDRYDLAQKLYLLNQLNVTSRYLSVKPDPLPASLLMTMHIMDLSAHGLAHYGPMNATDLLIQLRQLRGYIAAKLLSFPHAHARDGEALRDPNSRLRTNASQIMQWIVKVRHNEHAQWLILYDNVRRNARQLHRAYCASYGTKDIWLCRRHDRRRSARTQTDRPWRPPVSRDVADYMAKREEVHERARAIKALLFDDDVPLPDEFYDIASVGQ